MFYRVGKPREKQKTRKDRRKPLPISTHPGCPSFFFLFFFPQTKNPVHPYLIPSSRPFSFPIKKSCSSCLHPAIPSLSFPNQQSRSSLSYPVILSFLFPKRKSRQSCLYPAILSKIIPSILSKNSIQKPKHPKRDLSIVPIF